ncbi:hypothetical protein V6N13_132267 [Hibiscus sabdariffa]|uniref:Uncharacterized protein n=1 Tax=Hibiscus sabdariffa TaxID=183260 RepID=A0ABR2PV03_9ROSI
MNFLRKITKPKRTPQPQVILDVGSKFMGFGNAERKGAFRAETLCDAEANASSGRPKHLPKQGAPRCRTETDALSRSTDDCYSAFK